MKNIAFLTYLNRSGSTWLARLLDDYSEISVSPEARIPDGIAYGPIGLETASDVEGFLERLYADFKFRAWGINRDVLRERITNASFPVGFDTLLRLILKEYFTDDDDARTYIYKSPYVKCMKAARRTFPDDKFLFVLRDIRAVYNSQKKSIGSTTGQAMSDNPVTTGLSFKQVLSIVDEFSEEKYFQVVKYEDLVRNQDSELARLLDFLGVNSKKKVVGRRYSEKIVPKQRHLHSNVEYSALGDRISAWEHELTKLEIMTLQKVAKDELVKYGYKLIEFDKVSFFNWLGYYWLWLKHYGRILKKTAVGLKMLWRFPGLIRKGHLHLIAPNLTRSVDAMVSRLKVLKK